MCAAQSPTDIRKMGYLKKLKTNKKKLFLLREESDAGPARLEYYDSEKKFKAGGAAKRWIPLRTCFNINKKSDAKHKYAIALYTKEDCFSVVYETEVEQEEWLAMLLELQNEHMTEGDEPRPFFEHIWQVTVKPRGLGNGKNLTAGPYRLCLTNKTLSLVRLSQHDPDIIFQLASLRRCGHSDCFFFMEAGSSAVTGAGELWMQVEDTVIARNIHETILRNMAGDQPFRPRSRSSVSDRRSTKPVSVPSNSRGASPGYDSSTLPVRSKTISGEHPGSPTPPSRLRPGGNKGSSSGRSSTTSSLGRGHSPVPTSPLGHTLSDAHRSRTDSMESHGSRGTVSSLSADELDLSPHDHHSSTASTRSVTPEGGLTRDDPSYLSMMPMGAKDSHFSLPTDMMVGGSPIEDVLLPYILVSPTSDVAVPSRDAYMEMSASGISSYMDMSPGDNAYREMGRASFSSSPAMSTTSSGHDTDEHCYLDMVSIAHSLPTVQERITDAGYLDMSPGNTWTKGPILRPERVHSYLSDDQASAEDFPRRAYSVGSKPTSGKSHAECNVASYVDMTGKNGTLDKVNPKSSSAPHLVDKEKGTAYAQQREDVSRSSKELAGGRTTVYNKELLMEFDFLSQGSPFRPRTSSAGRDFRNRTSSIEQAVARRRTGSFGKESGVSRTASMGRHDRPRTTTICQDSFRNRTSSFGSTDMRPRSSSHGSRSYYKGKVASMVASTTVSGVGSEKCPSETDSRGSSRHSSQESLRRTLQKASEEYSTNKGSQDSYMDMLMRRTPSPSVPSNLTPSRSNEKAAAATAAAATQKINSLWQNDEYLTMIPGGDGCGSPGGTSAGGAGRLQPTPYMDMTYTPETHKDMRRRTLDNTAPKTPESKSSPASASKSRGNRSSIKSQQHHRLYLRMPSTESKSGGGVQQTEPAMEDSMPERPASKSPGEYIDIGFSNPLGSPASLSSSPCPGVLGKQRSSEDEDSKAVWSPQTDVYAVYSPGPALAMGPVGAGLEPIICPLRLDDDDDDTPNASPNAVMPDSGLSSLPNTPNVQPALADASDDYMLLAGPNTNDRQPSSENTSPSLAVMTSDPFALLGSLNQGGYTKASDSVYSASGISRTSDVGFGHQEQKAPPGDSKPVCSRSSSTKAVPAPPLKGSAMGFSSSSCSNTSNSRSRLSSNGSKNLSSRKSPVLPPKVRSKERSSYASLSRTSAVPPKVEDASTVTKEVRTSSAVATTVSVTAVESDYTSLRWPRSATSEWEKGHAQSRLTGLASQKNYFDHPKQPPNLALGSVPPFAELAPLTLGVHTEKLAPGDAVGTKTSTQEPTVVQCVAGKPSKLSGSTSSLSAIEPAMSSASAKSQITSRGSTSSLSSMDTTRTLTTACPGSMVSDRVGPHTMHTAARLEHLTPATVADSENLAVGGRASHHSSRTSISSEKELNYASLDLASSQDESTFPVMAERSPRSPLICKTTQSPVCEEEGEEIPLSYAEIDFAKSEELRTAASLRERLPFDVM